MIHRSQCEQFLLKLSLAKDESHISDVILAIFEQHKFIQNINIFSIVDKTEEPESSVIEVLLGTARESVCRTLEYAFLKSTFKNN